MKGYVQGYGNYEELTSSGVDPTELFDDIEDSIKSPDLMEADIVVEEYDDVADQQDIKNPDHTHLLPVEKARRRIGRAKPSGSSSVDPDNFGIKFDAVLEEMSLTTGPSLHSLVSAITDDQQIMEIKVQLKSCISCIICTI